MMKTCATTTKRKLNSFRLQVRLGHRNISINDDMKVLNILKPDIHPNFTKDVVYFDVAILTTEIVDLQPGDILDIKIVLKLTHLKTLLTSEIILYHSNRERYHTKQM